MGIVARLDWQLLISRQISTLLARFDGNKLDLLNTWLRDYTQWHQSLIDAAQRAKQPALAQALQQLTLPQSVDNKPQWQALSETFAQLMRTQRGWPTDLEWTTEAIGTLSRYFLTNKLYLDCLAVASVSDREKFKNLAIPLPNLQPTS